MIIWGSTGREIVLSSGRFYCPECDAESGYQHKRVARYFTLYFIPLFQIENLGEYVECTTCRQSFKESVLTYEPPSQAERMVLSVRADLETGTPVQMAQKKLVNAGVDEETAGKVVEVAAGEAPKECGACNLSYYESVARCSNCGNAL